MQILLINNIGSGFADYVDVEPGTTIESFLDQHLSGYKPPDLLIRVNRLRTRARHRQVPRQRHVHDAGQEHARDDGRAYVCPRSGRMRGRRRPDPNRWP